MSDPEQTFAGVAHGAMNGASPTRMESPLAEHGLHGRMPGSGRRPGGMNSSGAYLNGSRRSSFNSDMDVYSASDVELHTEISEISSQVNRIQQTLTALEEHQMDDKHIRLKQDNAVLQERINMLEETLQAAEDRWKEKLNEERNRHKDLIGRVERERDLQCEALTLKLQLLQREHSACASLHEKLTSELESLRADNASQDERIGVLTLQLNDLTQDHEDASGRLSETRKSAEEQVSHYETMIEELQAEVSHLKEINNNRNRSGTLFERSAEQEEELAILREEKQRLIDQNEDLQAQILQLSVEQGRILVAGPGNLADELDTDTMSKTQVMIALRDQEMTNQKLRTYVDGILLRVIEMYPAILEIKDDTPNSGKS